MFLRVGKAHTDETQSECLIRSVVLVQIPPFSYTQTSYAVMLRSHTELDCELMINVLLRMYSVFAKCIKNASKLMSCFIQIRLGMCWWDPVGQTSFKWINALFLCFKQKCFSFLYYSGCHEAELLLWKSSAVIIILFLLFVLFVVVCSLLLLLFCNRVSLCSPNDLIFWSTDQPLSW